MVTSLTSFSVKDINIKYLGFFYCAMYFYFMKKVIIQTSALFSLQATSLKLIMNLQTLDGFVVQIMEDRTLPVRELINTSQPTELIAILKELEYPFIDQL